MQNGLTLAGIIFLFVATMGQCFASVLKTVLITRMFLISLSTACTESVFFFVSHLTPAARRKGVHMQLRWSTAN